MALMKRAFVVMAVAGGTLAAGRAVVARRSNPWKTAAGGRDADHSRWHAVTVNRPLNELTAADALPEPLAALGDGVETRMRAAPGGRGTEVLARSAGAGPRAVRRALREAKSLLETGEVLRPDAPATTERTLLNRPLEYATRHGREDGTL
jgi:hypothetical protein